MDRAKFCKMLLIAKEYSSKTTSEISFDMRILPGGLRRIERGLFAFRMDRCLAYLSYIGYHIRMKKGESVVDVLQYQDIIDWFVEQRRDKPKTRLAADLGIDRTYFLPIENGENIISIDIFLKFADYFQYSLTLTPNE